LVRPEALISQQPAADIHALKPGPVHKGGQDEAASLDSPLRQDNAAPPAGPATKNDIGSTLSSQLAKARDENQRTSKELKEKNALLEECRLHVTMQGDELAYLREHTCWPGAINKILCITDYPPHDTGSEEVNKADKWQVWKSIRLMEILRNMNRPFKGTIHWPSLAEMASTTASDETARLSLLEPAAHNVARYSGSSFITASGVSGSGKSTTLLRLASHLGQLMLAQQETKALRIYFTYFSLSGEEIDAKSLTAEEMERWRARVASTSDASIFDRMEKVLVSRRQKPYWVVYDQTALAGALQHAKGCQEDRASSLNPHAKGSHLVIDMSRVVRKGVDEETVANGALVILDIQGGSTPAQPLADLGARTIHQWLTRGMVGDPQSKETNTSQLHQFVSRAHYSFSALITHLNVNHPTTYNEHTLSIAENVT
jgi:hypothetical protein